MRRFLSVVACVWTVGAGGGAFAAERAPERIAVFAGPSSRQAFCWALDADGFELREEALRQELGRGIGCRGVVFVSDAEEILSPRAFRSAVKAVRERYPETPVFHFTAPGVASTLEAESIELFVAEKSLADFPSADTDCLRTKIRPFVEMIIDHGWALDHRLAAPLRAARRRVYIG